MGKATYKSAGVDLDVYREIDVAVAGTDAPHLLAARDAARRRVCRPVSAGFRQPALRPALRGPGAGLWDRRRGDEAESGQPGQVHNSVGIDLVAMCVNDVICCGAEPLFFLDYVAMSHDDPDLLEQVVEGISDGCLQADCALLGGETAIMPDLYARGDYDLAGFCRRRGREETPDRRQRRLPQATWYWVSPRAVCTPTASAWCARSCLNMAGLSVQDEVPELGGTVGSTLLTPTRIYARAVRRVLRHYTVKNVVHGIAHITGGGMQENVERILPGACRCSH